MLARPEGRGLGEAPAGATAALTRGKETRERSLAVSWVGKRREEEREEEPERTARRL